MAIRRWCWHLSDRPSDRFAHGALPTRLPAFQMRHWALAMKRLSAMNIAAPATANPASLAQIGEPLVSQARSLGIDRRVLTDMLGIMRCLHGEKHGPGP